MTILNHYLGKGIPTCPIGYEINSSKCNDNKLCCVKDDERNCDQDCSRKLCQRSNGKWDSNKNQNIPYICELGI